MSSGTTTLMELKLQLRSQAEARALFGPQDSYLRAVRQVAGAKVILQGNAICISGQQSEVEHCADLLRQLRTTLRIKDELVEDDIRQLLDPSSDEDELDNTFQSVEDSNLVADISATPTAPKNRDVQASRMGKDKVSTVRARTPGQETYLKAMADKSLVFCDGPAGCGKTYLAVAMALQALRDEEVRKIVLVRPAVEAGEKLGFLPGDMFAKVNPFIRPLLDAMHDMLDFDQVRRYMANDVIEIAPLAFMRGRTLNDTFMILDEGQNTTITQMKMFLTRMGTDSRIVVTGDATQNDLPNDTQSGLRDGIRRLSGIDGVAIVRLTGQDIVRHRLVREIVSAYEADDTGTTAS